MGLSPQRPKPMGETSINRGFHQQRNGLEFVIQNSSPQGLNFSLKLKTIYLKLRVFTLEEASKEHILETSPHLYSSSTLRKRLVFFETTGEKASLKGREGESI